MSRNQVELESRILEFNKKEYVEKVETFMQKYYCTFDDGHASKKVVNHLKKYM